MTERKHDIKIYFSDFFGVSSETIRNHGSFNISLINDLPLFVDPFLLFNSEKDEYKALHKDIVNYLSFLQTNATSTLPKGLMEAWYCFPEVRQNWFGYSKIGNGGHGLGRTFANNLNTNLHTVFDIKAGGVGIGVHLEKLCLIKNGVGRDNISDFVTNLIKGYLAQYTEDFAKKYVDPAKCREFPVTKAEFNYHTKTWITKRYMLPAFCGDFVLLTPIDMLTKDETWINHADLIADFSSVAAAVPNEQLRAQISNYVIQVMPLEPTKKDRDEAYEKVLLKFPMLLDAYIALKEREGDGAKALSEEKVKSTQILFEQQLRDLVELLWKGNFYEIQTNTREDALQRLNYLKHVIEKQDGYKLFYVEGKPVRRETDLQIMFKLTWLAATFDYNAEVNNGRGPADFVVSFGSTDKTVIEFKLASNTSLESNLKKQAEIYSDAARANRAPIKAILYFTEAEHSKVHRLLRTHELIGDNNIILIDATDNKPSASKA
ncbi:hypothetical protein [Cupriavidus necator]|uniref:hypothetical protein n=1 Tax=Cupriavidus necator TaxID=106590 RepID=UPI00339D966F